MFCSTCRRLLHQNLIKALIFQGDYKSSSWTRSCVQEVAIFSSWLSRCRASKVARSVVTAQFGFNTPNVLLPESLFSLPPKAGFDNSPKANKPERMSAGCPYPFGRGEPFRSNNFTHTHGVRDREGLSWVHPDDSTPILQ